MNAEFLIPLELLGPGEWGDIAEVHGEQGCVCRMAELGLHPGSRIRMIRSGSPCLLMVGNSRLCLRGDWAMQVLVRPVQLVAGQPDNGFGSLLRKPTNDCCPQNTPVPSFGQAEGA